MGQARKEDFCVYCREVRPYSAVRKNIRERIRDKDYSFVITTYVCGCCHHEMSVPGVFDLNSREIDEQYRKAESIVSIEDIRDLMEIFNIGKTPLSLALGFARSLLRGILRDRCRPRSTLTLSAALCARLRS